MMIDLATQIADPARFGWKAHYISRLVREGFVVPSALALAPDEAVDPVLFDPDLAYAVRSSGLSEDSRTSSFAGHFTTHLDVRGRENVTAAIDDVRASGVGEMPMGVVVQQMVDKPTISGVAFSVHPVSLAHDVAVVSWVHDLGAGLVSGEIAGNDLVVCLDDNTIVTGEWPLDEGTLSGLTASVLRLHELLERPVDIEWCVSSSGTLTLLQMRPIVLPDPAVISLDIVEAFDSLPNGVASHSKLALRAEAARHGVPMSSARAILATQPGGLPSVPPFLPGKRSAGRSVVLVHPARIEGKIVREFTTDCSTDVEFFVRGCQRYAIRQYPDHGAAAQSVAHTLGLGLDHGAIACVIEQEILHAYATGILRRIDDGYLVEVALGHFVPKGYVETSLFTLANDLTVTMRMQTPQSKAYHFMNGHVIVETPPYEPLALSDSDLQRLIRAMQPILDSRPGVALEFGLLGYAGEELEPYMIDVADSDTQVLTTTNIGRGVVAPGTATGPVVDLRNTELREDLNAHLYDAVLTDDSGLAPAIYIAPSASLDLLPIVRAAHRTSGFIFERASLLAHLAVVLRERGLAAVVMPADALETLLRSAERLSICTVDETIVTAQEEPKS
jgi:hypothetical protein